MEEKHIRIGDFEVILNGTVVEVKFKGKSTSYGGDFQTPEITRQEALIKAQAYYQQCVASFTQMEQHYQNAMLGIA